jgi:ketol-acid reductoisomerase
MKLTKEKTEKKGQEILRYMQTGEFKKYMMDNVEKSKSAYNLLIKEVTSHKKIGRKD